MWLFQETKELSMMYGNSPFPPILNFNDCLILPVQMYGICVSTSHSFIMADITKW